MTEVKEKWVDIKGYEGLYEVSNMGRIKSIDGIRGGKKNRYFQKGRFLSTNSISKKGYCVATLFKKGSRNKVYIHRVVADNFIGSLIGKQIDHIDWNKTNNRLDNLRVCSNSQNQSSRLRLKPNNATSKYRGVKWNSGKWAAGINFNNKHIYLGRYSNEIEAAIVYDKYAVELFGEFAKPNFV